MLTSPLTRISRIALLTSFVSVCPLNAGDRAQRGWTIDSAEQWQQATDTSTRLNFANGQTTPTDNSARFESVLKTFDHPRRAVRVTFKQTPAWDNWKPVPTVGPNNTYNAPVFLPVANGDYWYFAEERGKPHAYRAFHSTDMKTWTGYGEVTPSRWMTTAEYADGKFYLYYDKPNDEDPHLIVHDDLTEPENGKVVGKVFDDPSHGSDAGILRDVDGTFHLIYEDWSPINARQHSWDSPLAGHATSEDGIHGFEPHETAPPIDERTEATDKFGTYRHPNGEYRYRKHKGSQNAYGDFTQIKVGGHYYLFCDYDPHNKPMRVGYWSSDDISQPFEWGGSIGKGFHPDPTVGFAEGQFYLIVQRHGKDYISRGPWVDAVQARAGVDTDNDGQIDQWTDWQTVRETYARNPGFARVIETTPATLDLTALPAGRGFKFAFRIKPNPDAGHDARAIIDRVIMSFE
jgi:hypothetical protein